MCRANMQKKLLFFFSFILLSLHGFGQGDVGQSYFDEFNQFSDQINSEYANFLSRAWEEFEVFVEEPLYSKPKPATIPIAPKTQESLTEKEIAIGEVERPKVNAALQPEPKDNMRVAEKGKVFTANITYYGSTLSISYPGWQQFQLTSTKENGVAALWKDIDKTGASSLIKGLWAYKNKQSLNDWAYYLLVRQVANKLMDMSGDDAKIVFLCYLLVNSGYDARIARVDDSLVLLLPTSEELFNAHFLLVDKRKYYLFSNKELAAQMSIFTYRIPVRFKQGGQLSLALTTPILFAENMKAFTTQAAGLTISGQINKNKIDFYNDYPSCVLSVYAQAVPDESLHRALQSSFNKYLAGKTTLQKLQLLMEWMHRGFNYKTDGDQFGCERPFFLEENFFYPYNDCEDRAMLFAYLVRQLLGLEVVLLRYPEHIATAVCLPDDIAGMYILINDKRFYICDPTYINGKVGECMSQYKNTKAKVLEYY